MADERKPNEAFSLRRWSQRKLAAAREERRPAETRDTATDPPEALVPEAKAQTPSAGAVDLPGGGKVGNADGGVVPHIARGERAPGAPQEGAAPLPPIESLTFDSDFSAFMQPGVDANVRRTALRKLLRDPHFNVMDGLDVYIDDYSKPDPIEPEIVRTLVQARYLFDPPKTRVNDEGYAEDVVDDGAHWPGTPEAEATAPGEAAYSTPPRVDDTGNTSTATDVPALAGGATTPAVNADGDPQDAKEASHDERA